MCMFKKKKKTIFSPVSCKQGRKRDLVRYVDCEQIITVDKSKNNAADFFFIFPIYNKLWIK